MTYYDRLNRFFAENETNPLNPAAQLVYLHLIHENNRLRDPKTFCVTDSRLATITGLSRQAITTAKRQLKNRGFINFETKKARPRAGTIYTLPEGETPARAPRPENDGRQIDTTGAIISGELKAAWKMNNDGTFPTETEMYYLADDVKIYGADKVKRAIEQAGQKKRGSLSIYFYRMQLYDLASRKGGASNAKPASNIRQAESWEQQRPDWLDG